MKKPKTSLDVKAIIQQDFLAFKHFDEMLSKGETREQALRRLTLAWHPDKNLNDPEGAGAVLAHINELYQASDAPTEYPVGKWIVTDEICAGDISSIYYTKDRCVLKIANDRADNDLMDREKRSLELLAKGSDHFAQYVPRHLDAFSASGRRVNVHSVENYPAHSLEDIKAKVPNLDFRHIVWMMNRGLSVLGYAHRSGLIHGAVLPCHLMYEPEVHGLRLIDWCYSCESGQRIPAMVPDYESLYPIEVRNKFSVSPGTDMYMLAQSLHSAAKYIIPQRFVPLFEWCFALAQSARPQDAFAFQDLWKAAAQEEYGSPKFIELVIPER